MVYAITKEDFKKKLIGIAKDLQANSWGDVITTYTFTYILTLFQLPSSIKLALRSSLRRSKLAIHHGAQHKYTRWLPLVR